MPSSRTRSRRSKTSVPYDRCITRGVLASMLPTAYNMGTEIMQVPGAVVIRNEMIHETRIIPVDGRPRISSKIRSYMGDSRGHWEGDTLVIETINFNGKVGITRNGNTLLTSADLKLTERLTRVDADTLIYEATVDDPRTWTRPLEDLAAAHAASGVPVLRVRVPRRELRDAEHPQRGTGGGKGGAREWDDQPALTLLSTPNYQFPTPKIGYWKLGVGGWELTPIESLADR